MPLTPSQNQPPTVCHERIQKYLAHQGLGSRREIEGWIKAKRIKINGRVAQLGDRLEKTCLVELDGKAIKKSIEKFVPQIILYHKPAGEICSRFDKEGRQLIFANLPQLNEGRWINIGRLDLNTSGLLLLTNYGDWAHQLMHPSHGFEREYLVRILGQPSKQDIERLKNGLNLDGQWLKFNKIQAMPGKGANHWFRVVVTEGKYRIIRRLWQALHYPVSRLIRVRYGSINLPKDLALRNFIKLKKPQIVRLLNLTHS